MHHPVFGIISLPHSVNLVHHLSPPSHHPSLPLRDRPNFDFGFGFGAECVSIDSFGLLSASAKSQIATFGPHSVSAESAFYLRLVTESQIVQLLKLVC